MDAHCKMYVHSELAPCYMSKLDSNVPEKSMLTHQLTKGGLLLLFIQYLLISHSTYDICISFAYHRHKSKKNISLPLKVLYQDVRYICGSESLHHIWVRWRL